MVEVVASFLGGFLLSARFLQENPASIEDIVVQPLDFKTLASSFQ